MQNSEYKMSLIFKNSFIVAGTISAVIFNEMFWEVALRIFEKLTFLGENSTDYFLHSENFEILEEYFKHSGFHVKNLFRSILQGVDPMIVLKLLNLLPNLECLHLDVVNSESATKETIKWDLKSTKIERIVMYKCYNLNKLLESLEKCRIKELHLSKLHDMSVGFLRAQVDLRILRLTNCEVSGEACNIISELENLEELEFNCRVTDRRDFYNFHKLQKLKKLIFYNSVDRNILDQLKFGVFSDLVELHASLEGASMEAVQEMNRITPNLKKIVVHFASSDTINALLETLENLETVDIYDVDWEVPEKVCPKIKYLHVFRTVEFRFSADQFSRVFPNLEYFKLTNCIIDVTESFFVTLLSRLKQLKTLYLHIYSDSKLVPQSLLQCFQKYGNNLENASVVFGLRNLKSPPFKIDKGTGTGGSFSINETKCITILLDNYNQCMKHFREHHFFDMFAYK
jgi:hypothetical protein